MDDAITALLGLALLLGCLMAATNIAAVLGRRR